jgi:hypothetical protein
VDRDRSPTVEPQPVESVVVSPAASRPAHPLYPIA